MTPVSDRQHDAFDNQHKEVRYLDIHEDDQLDEARLATWIRQAAALPGWVPQRPGVKWAIVQKAR
jgi:hypothetical protein